MMSTDSHNDEDSSSNIKRKWTAGDKDQAEEARRKLNIWPLDRYNADLLNEVHPRDFQSVHSQEKQQQQQEEEEEDVVYDLIAVGAGAGGLVSSKQAARRGAKSALISEALAGGDCLNVGCVPSKALIRSARAVSQVKQAAKFGVLINGRSTGKEEEEDFDIKVDFAAVMARVRKCRATIAPADGHSGSESTGAHVFQGRGIFTGPNTVQVNGQTLKFKTAVIATGGRPTVPSIPGLKESPYITNEQLFNLEELPPRMIILGAGVIALEMAQSFALLGSKVTVVNRSSRLFESKGGDVEAAEILQTQLEKDGVTFLSKANLEKVETIEAASAGNALNGSFTSLMKVSIDGNEHVCECLLVAAGRSANIENLGLESANVDFENKAGVKVDDFSRSTSNPSIYAVGDCVAGVPRLTHMSGEMAKLVVQNALAKDSWKLSQFVVPAVAYTEPEYATIGIASEDQASQQGLEVDVFRAGLEHNDRAICEGSNIGFCKIVVKKGTDEIVGATIVAERAGEMINEVSLAMKNNLGLHAIGRNIHSYPTTGEAVMGCGVKYINSKLPRFD